MQFPANHKSIINSSQPPHVHVTVGIVQLEQRAQNTWLALEQGRRPRGARRQSSIMNDRRIEQLGEDLFNPPGPINQAIFRFLSAASHQMENLVNELLRQGPRPR